MTSFINWLNKLKGYKEKAIAEKNNIVSHFKDLQLLLEQNAPLTQILDKLAISEYLELAKNIASNSS